MQCGHNTCRHANLTKRYTATSFMHPFLTTSAHDRVTANFLHADPTLPFTLLFYSVGGRTNKHCFSFPSVHLQPLLTDVAHRFRAYIQFSVFSHSSITLAATMINLILNSRGNPAGSSFHYNHKQQGTQHRTLPPSHQRPYCHPLESVHPHTYV